MKAIELEQWDYDLVRQVIDIAGKFISETEFPVSFSYDHVYERLSTAFHYPDAAVFLLIDDRKVFGAAVCYAVSDWHPERFGYLEKLFVVRERRGLGGSRILMEKIRQWFDDRDCVFSFATGTARIGETGQFQNLLAKYGYIPIGPTLARGKNHNGKICTRPAEAARAKRGTTQGAKRCREPREIE
jgi:GNAT superfamily N-acetyltransferase